jgi:hypothetical protein
MIHIAGILQINSGERMYLKVNLANIVSISLMGGLGYALLIGISSLRTKFGGSGVLGTGK